MPAIDFSTDFFALFQLPQGFRVDGDELDRRWRELQGEVHPDRFAAASDAEKRLSMQWATRINEAYQTLKKPLPRAKYLLHLAGHDLGAENNTAMSPDFLIEQMEWREAVQESRTAGDHHELEHLHHRLQERLAASYAALAKLFEAGDAATAIDPVRRLMFLEKLLHEIDDALISLDDH